MGKFVAFCFKLLKLSLCLLIVYSLFATFNYLDVRSSFMRSYNWNLGRSFALADAVMVTINNNQEVSPEYLFDLYLALNVAVEENRLFNTTYRTRLPIKVSELEQYSSSLRIIAYKSIKGVLNQEDLSLLKTICSDFASLGSLLRNDNRISYGEYEKVRPTLLLFSDKIDVLEYSNKNRYVFKD